MIEQHTHSFFEVLSVDDGLLRRCQCGARLWEPQQADEIALRFSSGNVVKQGGRLVFKPHNKGV